MNTKDDYIQKIRMNTRDDYIQKITERIQKMITYKRSQNEYKR